LAASGLDDFMRSMSFSSAAAGTLLLALACGGDDVGTPPSENAAPVASFAVPSCTLNVPCDFVSTSTDDAAVTAWSWDFDSDGTPDATTESASFTYSAAGTFNVSLTVRDAQGLSSTSSSPITIAPVDGTPPPPTNTPPTASFTFACTGLDCAFTSTSTDAAPGTIATYAWTLGDNATADVANPTHTYAATAATDFTVTLTVTDNEGATDSETQTVTVTPPPLPNTPPTAGFTFTCSAASCSFTSTSTDAAPGTIAAFAWDFGDGGSSTVASPSHTFAVVNPADFTVTLTVTDNDGATDTETQTVHVTPPPPGAEGCTTSGNKVDCRLDIVSRSTIKLKLIGVSCDLHSQRVVIPPPSNDQVFLNVCAHAVGDSTRIFGGPGDHAFIFEAGSQATIRFVQGTPSGGEPTPNPPAGQLTGTFPTWTINFEDGDNPGVLGEPDFTDVVLQVEAVAAP
jgi:PKD repeat protein